MEDVVQEISGDVIINTVNLSHATVNESAELRNLLDEQITIGHSNIVVDLSQCIYIKISIFRGEKAELPIGLLPFRIATSFGIPDGLGKNDSLFFTQADLFSKYLSIDPIANYRSQPESGTEKIHVLADETSIGSSIKQFLVVFPVPQSGKIGDIDQIQRGICHEPLFPAKAADVFIFELNELMKIGVI